MPLRLAIVGAGHLGRFHAKLARELDDVALVGIADPVEVSARRLAGECGAAAVSDVSELAGKIDAAVVAAPTRWHHTIGCELLSRGVHVLMEKPLAITVAECDELVRLAERHRCVLQAGHIERFNPALEQALPFLNRPQYIDAVRHTGYTFRSTDVGVVLDLMIHDLDIALALVGAPVADVSAFAMTAVGGHEDFARARLHFANGTVADFSASRVSHQPNRQMQIWSAGGNVSIDFAGRSAVVAQPAAMLRRGQFDPAALAEHEKARLRERFFEELMPLRRLETGATNALLEEQRDFVSAIRNRREPRVTGRQAREVIAVAERISQSIVAHRWDEPVSEAAHYPSLTACGRSEPRADVAADILRGPHWNLNPIASADELKRPA